MSELDVFIARSDFFGYLVQFRGVNNLFLEGKDMKKVFLFLLMTAVVLSLAACSTSTSESESESEDTPVYRLELIDVQRNTWENPWYDDGTTLVKPVYDYVALVFDVTNESDESIWFDGAVSDRLDVFQNGIGLDFFPYNADTRFYDGIEGAINAHQDAIHLQAGAKARVVWYFDLEDDSPLSVEISNGQKFEIYFDPEDGSPLSAVTSSNGQGIEITF